MRDILDRLTALGVRADDLLEIAEAFKARERLLARRAHDLKRVVTFRKKSNENNKTVTLRHVSETPLSSSEERIGKEEKQEHLTSTEVSTSPGASPKKRLARLKTTLPDGWQPKGEQRDPTEADEFRDHARAKGYQYLDWDAAYRNFQKSQYNVRNGNKGQRDVRGRRHGSVLDAADRLGEKLRAAGATDDYIPGSSGPPSLELDTQARPANLRLVPKR